MLRGAGTGRHRAIADRGRATYRRLEQAQLEHAPPEAFAAFLEYLAAERNRTERFAARLSLHRRAEHLAAFDSDEYPTTSSRRRSRRSSWPM